MVNWLIRLTSSVSDYNSTLPAVSPSIHIYGALSFEMAFRAGLEVAGPNWKSFCRAPGP